MGIALMLSGSRGAGGAAVVAGIYLVWVWKRRVVLAVPIVLVVGFLVAPAFLKERVTSTWAPKANTDSNRFRLIVWRTGWEMIKAHPVFGLGPEEISKDE